MKKRIGSMALLGLTILVISGCGQKESAADGMEPTEPVEMTVYKEPPAVELRSVSEEGDSLLVKACGYTWNWPEGAELMGSAIADGPSATAEGNHWETLLLPESSDGLSEYMLTIEVMPDELGIDVWDAADIGNNEAQGSRIAVYRGAEIAAADFSIPLQAGKIYQIYMEWDEEKIGENGCSGIAYYIFKTAWPVQEETEDSLDGLTESVEEGQEFPEATFGEVYTNEISSIDGVMMTVTNVTSEGASLEILNQTDKEITFGDDYELQAWQDGSWYRVDYIIDNWAFNMIGYETEPESAKESPLRLEVTWTYFHGILPAGRYRITKTALVQENDALVQHLFAAEFEVK